MSQNNLAEYIRAISLADWIDVFGTVFSPEKAERIKFNLWPMQRRFCNSLENWQAQGFNETANPKARQNGVSEIAGERCLKDSMAYPKNKILVISGDQDKADEFLNVRLYEKYLALPQNQGIVWPKLVRKTRDEIEFSNGSVVISLPAKDTAGQGFTGAGVVLDECGAIDMNVNASFDAVYKNVRPSIEKSGKRGWLMQVGTSEPSTAWNEKIKRIVNGKDRFTKLFFMGWKVDPSRDEAWYQRTLESSASEVDFKTQYPETIEDFFVVKGGVVVPQFSREKHVKEFEPPDKNVRLYFGYDDGFAHPSVFLTTFYDYVKDHLFVWSEEYWVRKSTEEKAPMVKSIQESTESRFNLMTYRKIADSAIWQKRSSLSIADEFRLQGVEFTPAYKHGGLSSPDGSLEKMRRYFKNDQITIHPRCQNLIEDLMSWKYKKGGQEKIEDIHDDGPDTLRYILEDVRRTGFERKEEQARDLGYGFKGTSLLNPKKDVDTDAWMRF